MASPQLEDGYIAIARELQDAIMQTKFSKRQRSILDLILRLSYGCSKKDCIIPKQKDFEVIGIKENHIKEEINHLIEAKVIGRDGEIYWINKDYDLWRVSISARSTRLKELLHLNLTSQNGKIVKKELPKKGSRDFPKGEVKEELSIENHSEKDLSITVDNKRSSYNRERELLTPQPHKKLGGDSLSSLSPEQIGEMLQELLDHWNSVKPDKDCLKACTHVLILSYPAKEAIKKCLATGYSLDDLKQSATNFQDNLNRQGKNGKWPKTSLRIETFYIDQGLFTTYLPANYKGEQSEPDDSEVPTFIGNV